MQSAGIIEVYYLVMTFGFGILDQPDELVQQLATVHAVMGYQPSGGLRI